MPAPLRALYRLHDGIAPPEDEIPTAFAACYFMHFDDDYRELSD